MKELKQVSQIVFKAWFPIRHINSDFFLMKRNIFNSRVISFFLTTSSLKYMYLEVNFTKLSFIIYEYVYANMWMSLQIICETAKLVSILLF